MLKDNLKRIRKENNLSQEQLADKLNVSRQSVSKWESGQAYPEMDKGRNWEGGLGAGKDIDKMCDKLMSEYGLGADNLGDRLDKLMDFWEAQFKKDKITESAEPEKPLSKMNTNELRDYAVSLGADKKELYGTSKSSLILIIDRIKKEGNKTFTYDVYRIVDVGDFSKDKMDIGDVKGTILDIKDKAKRYGKIKSINHTTKEIIVENAINEEYVNKGKVTVDNFKKWLQQQVKDSSTPKDIKSFIQKQLNDIDTAKTKYGDDTEKKLCQKLADEIWELDITIV